MSLKEAEKIEVLSVLSIIFHKRPDFYDHWEAESRNGRYNLLIESFEEAISLFTSESTKKGLNDLKKVLFEVSDLFNMETARFNIDILVEAYWEIFNSDEFDIDDLYDELSRKSKANNEVELTPNHVVDLMVDLADIQDDDVVMDYCLGTARFLTNVHHKNPSAKLVGVEVKRDLFLLSCGVMYCNDRPDAIIIHGNLMNDKQLQSKLKNLVTKCILNPPYNASEWSPKQFFFKGMDLMAEGGRFVFIGPVSVFKTVGDITNFEINADERGSYDLKSLALMNSDLFKAGTKSAAGTLVNITVVDKQEYQNDTKVLDWQDDGFEVVLKKGRLETGDWGERKNCFLQDFNDSTGLNLQDTDECVYQAHMQVNYDLVEFNFMNYE